MYDHDASLCEYHPLQKMLHIRLMISELLELAATQSTQQLGALQMALTSFKFLKLRAILTR